MIADYSLYIIVNKSHYLLIDGVLYGPLHNKTAVENFEKAIDEVKSQVILSHNIIIHFNYYLYRVEQLNMVARYGLY